MKTRAMQAAISVLLCVAMGGCDLARSYHGLGSENRVVDQSLAGRWYPVTDDEDRPYRVPAAVDVRVSGDGYDIWFTDDEYGAEPTRLRLHFVRSGEDTMFDLRRDLEDDGEMFAQLRLHHLGVAEWSEKTMVLGILLDAAPNEFATASGVEVIELNRNSSGKPPPFAGLVSDDEDKTDAAFDPLLQNGPHLLVGTSESLRAYLSLLKGKSEKAFIPLILTRHPNPLGGLTTDNEHKALSAAGKYDPLLKRSMKHALEMGEAGDAP